MYRKLIIAFFAILAMHLHAQTGAGLGMDNSPAAALTNPEPFALRISVYGIIGSDIRVDNYNYLSVHEDALDSYDIYDVREPTLPPPAGSIDAYFRLGAFKLSRDTRQNFSDTSKTWTFYVEDLPSGMSVTMMWPRNRIPTGEDASCGVENLDSRWCLTLIDNTTSDTMDMRGADTSYSFFYGTSSRNFTMILSDCPLSIETLAKPDRFAVGQIIPNPFNASMYFTLEIPFPTNVKVDIFDILGEKTATLFDGPMEFGRNRIVWDGRDDSGRKAPGGIYMCRVTAGDFRAISRIILIK